MVLRREFDDSKPPTLTTPRRAPENDLHVVPERRQEPYETTNMVC